MSAEFIINFSWRRRT